MKSSFKHKYDFISFSNTNEKKAKPEYFRQKIRPKPSICFSQKKEYCSSNGININAKEQANGTNVNNIVGAIDDDFESYA